MHVDDFRIPVPDGVIAGRTAGDGPAVVLLHGGSLDGRQYDPQLAALAGRFRVVVPDARGHGSSSTPAAPFRHTDDLAAVLSALGTGPALLAGTSLGASTAVDTALEHPHLTAGVSVSGAGGYVGWEAFRDPWVHAVLAEWQAAAGTQDPQRWIEASLRFVHGPRRTLADVDPGVVARVRAMLDSTISTHIRPDPATGAVPPVPMVPVTDSWERAPSIAVPVLGLIGDRDTPDHIGMVERLVGLVPEGRTAVIEGAAHYPNLERPEEYTRALSEFADRVLAR